METDAFLRRLKETQARLKRAGKPFSDAALSRKATGKNDYIKDIKRGKSAPNDADRLQKLAEACEEPSHFFIDEAVTRPEGLSELRREWLRWALRAADRAMDGYDNADRDILRADIAADVYDALEESAAAGQKIDEAAFMAIGDSLIRRLVSARMRSRK